VLPSIDRSIHRAPAHSLLLLCSLGLVRLRARRVAAHRSFAFALAVDMDDARRRRVDDPICIVFCSTTVIIVDVFVAWRPVTSLLKYLSYVRGVLASFSSARV